NGLGHDVAGAVRRPRAAAVRNRRAVRWSLPRAGPGIRRHDRLDRQLPRGRRAERAERAHAARRHRPPGNPERACPGRQDRRGVRRAAPVRVGAAMAVGPLTLPILSAITWLPFVGALLIMFTARHRPRAVRWIAVVTTGISTLLSIYAYATYNHEAAGFQFYEKVPLVPPLGISYELGVDGVRGDEADALPALRLGGHPALALRAVRARQRRVVFLPPARGRRVPAGAPALGLPRIPRRVRHPRRDLPLPVLVTPPTGPG